MPNRIIKESICTSDNIDQLTPFQEVVFYRLMVNCDDFGRYDARAKLLSSRLFPLRNVTTEEIEDALCALQKADLITVYEVDGRPYLQMNTWEKHQQRRSDKSKYPSPDEGNCKQLQADDSNCNQLIADDSKCPRNRIRNRNTINDNRESLSSSENGLIDDDEAHLIQHDHDIILEAAKNAGFKCTPSEMKDLLDLYSEYGTEKMLDGFKACVDHSAPNLAYLRAVLKGEPKKPKPKVIAQDFQQRDYSDVDRQLEDTLAREIEAFNAKEVG